MSVIDKIRDKLKDASPSQLREILTFVEFLEAKGKKQPAGPQLSWNDFFGTLKDSKIFAGDPVEIQRKLRAEWD